MASILRRVRTSGVNDLWWPQAIGLSATLLVGYRYRDCTDSRNVWCEALTPPVGANNSTWKRLEHVLESAAGENRMSLHRIRKFTRTEANEEKLKLINQPPPSDYDGLHLELPLDEADAEKLILFAMEHDLTKPAMSGKWLHPFYVEQVLDAFTELLLRTVHSAVVDVNLLKPSCQIVVAGDLHGQLKDFLLILLKHGLPDDNRMYVFAGDIADRGSDAVDIFVLIFALKLAHPTRVHLIRGNHEDDSLNRCEYCGGFRGEVDTKFGKVSGRCIYAKFQTIFNLLPLSAVLENRILVVHGGVPTSPTFTMQELRRLPFRRKVPPLIRTREDKAMMDLLWGDPHSDNGVAPSCRGNNIETFGPDVTDQFLKRAHLDFIIRGHEVPEDNSGYEFQHNDRILTIFSASNYCGVTGNRGSTAVITRDAKPIESAKAAKFIRPRRMKSGTGRAAKLHLAEKERSPALNVKVFTHTADYVTDVERLQQVCLHDHLCEQLLSLLCDRRSIIRQYCCERDAKRTNHVPLDTWRKACSCAVPDLDEEVVQLVEPQLARGGVLNESINYADLLDSMSTRHIGALGDPGWKTQIVVKIFEQILRADMSLASLYQTFDPSDDGIVSMEEAVGVFLSCNLGLPKHELLQIVQLVNPTDDASISVERFLRNMERIHKQCQMWSVLLQAPEWITECVHEIVAHFRRRDMGHDPREMFQTMDLDGSGLVDIREFTGVLKNEEDLVKDLATIAGKHGHFSTNENLLCDLFKALDESGDGNLNYLEFLDAFVDPSISHIDLLCLGDVVSGAALDILHTNRKILLIAFESVDKRSSGLLTAHQFRKALDRFNKALADPDPPLKTPVLDVLESAVGNDSIDYHAFLGEFRRGLSR